MIRSAFRLLSPILPVLALTGSAWGQVAVVDVSDTAEPEVWFDPDPNIYLPAIPPDVLQMYYPSPTGTATAVVNAAQAQNAIAVAAISLGAAGIVTTTTGNETDPITSQQPAVITSNPDTHTLGRPGVYYIDPPTPPGPFKPAEAFPLRFDFGSPLSPVAPGYVQVTEQTAYGADTGYGWSDVTKVTSGDNGSVSAAGRDYCRVAHGRAGSLDAAKVSPTAFYADLPNGTYRVSVTAAPNKVGDTNRLSVWANGAPELVFSTKVVTGTTGSFTINIYDGRLQLEFFNGLDRDEVATDPNTWAYVNALTIEQVDTSTRKTTIYVASDSTAASYSAAAYPITGWGARLDRFFTNDVVIANYAVAGASSKSFYERRWLQQIENKILPGDFLFVMFAINDSADDSSKRKTAAGTTFKAYLRQYVDAAGARGAIPVFVTSQTKRTYDLWGRFTNSVQGYPQAQRELGAELNVPVLDLNYKSIQYLNAIGVDASADIYMFFPAGKYPDTAYKNGAADYIHLQDNGATQYAHLITQAIREINLQPLARFVVDKARF